MIMGINPMTCWINSIAGNITVISLLIIPELHKSFQSLHQSFKGLHKSLLWHESLPNMEDVPMWNSSMIMRFSLQWLGDHSNGWQKSLKFLCKFLPEHHESLQYLHQSLKGLYKSQQLHKSLSNVEIFTPNDMENSWMTGKVIIPLTLYVKYSKNHSKFLIKHSKVSSSITQMTCESCRRHLNQLNHLKGHSSINKYSLPMTWRTDEWLRKLLLH